MYQTGDVPAPGHKLEKRLGRGGFGEVWRAAAPGGMAVALKLIDLSNHHGLKELRAIHLVKRIRHPNLVPMFGFWLKDENGRIFDDVPQFETAPEQSSAAELIIAMGLGDKSLMDRLKECRREGKSGIPALELLDYMEDAAKAIDHLNQPIHDLGHGEVAIQHCDIKPQNILIVSGGAQVCDFGLARALGTDSRSTGGAGSLAYMSPEVIANSRPSKWTDQYSLAISYIELRTGSLPLDTSSQHAAMLAHTTGELDFSKVPASEQAVLRRATSLEPSARFSNTLEMVRALRLAASSAAPSSTPSTHEKSTIIHGPSDFDPSGVSTGSRPAQLTPSAGSGTLASGGIVPSTSLGQKQGRTEPLEGGSQTAVRPESAAAQRVSLTDVFHSATIGRLKQLSPARQKMIVLALGVIAVGLVYSALSMASQWLIGQVEARIQAKDYDGALAQLRRGRFLMKNRDRQRIVLALAQERFENGEHAPALAHLREEKVAPELASDLRLAVHKAVLDRAEEANRADKRSEALADAFLLREEFPDDKAAQKLIDSVWEATRTDVGRAMTEDLSVNPAAAVDVCANALALPRIAQDQPDLWRRSMLGKARAHARLDQWKQVENTLADFPKDVTPADDSMSRVLLALAKVQSTDPLASIQALAELRKPTNYAANLDANSWEETKLLDAQKKVVAEVSAELAKRPRTDGDKFVDWMGLLDPDQFTSVLSDLKLKFQQNRFDDCKVALKKAEGLAKDEAARKALDGWRQEAFQKCRAAADELRKSKNFVASRERLQLAAALAPGQVDADFKAVTALVYSDDPASTEPDLKSAGELYKELLKEKSPPRIVDLAKGVALLVGRKGMSMNDAVASLGVLLKNLPQGGPYTEFKSVYQDLVAKRIEETYPDLLPEKMAGLLEEFKSAIPTPSPLTEACQAECLIDSSYPQPPKREDREAAMAIVKSIPLEQAGGYGKYVQAVVRAASGESQADQYGDLLLGGFDKEQEPWAANPHRRQRAAMLLYQAAKDVGPKLQADLAYKYLMKAKTLAEPKGLGTPFQVALLLAAGFKNPPDEATVRQLGDALLPPAQPKAFDKPDPDVEANAVDLLWLAARNQPNTKEGVRKRLDQYTVLFGLKKARDPANPEKFLDDVVQPAINAGEEALRVSGATPEMKAQVARFQFAKGKLIRDHRWQLPKKEAVAMTAFEEAIKLDGTKARYYVEKAYSQIDLNRRDGIVPNYQALANEAKTAIDLDPNYAGGVGLRGFLGIYVARREQNNLRKHEIQLAALKDTDDAIKLCPPDDPDRLRPMFMINRSLIFLELGNSKEGPERLSFIENAVKEARAATKLEQVYPDYAYRALGNALEDIAFLGGGDPKHYGEAAKAFRDAIREQQLNPQPYIDLGRCLYRWDFDLRVAQNLKDAQGNLEKGLEFALTDKERAEAKYFLGRIARLRASLTPAEAAAHNAEARKLFEEASKLEKTEPREWAENSWEDLAEMAIERARALTKTKPDEAAKQLAEAVQMVSNLEESREQRAKGEGRRLRRALIDLQARVAMNLKEFAKARDLARQLGEGDARERDPYLAALLRGESFVLEGKFKEALAAFDAPLAEKDDFVDNPKRKTSYLKLCKERLRFWNDKPELSPGPKQAIQEAERLLPLSPAPEDRAFVLDMAGVAYLDLAMNSSDPAAQKSNGEAAVEKLRKAISVQKDHADNYFTRQHLVPGLQFLATKEKGVDPARYQSLLEEAKRELELLLKDPQATEVDRKKFNRALESVDKQLKNK